MELRFLRCAGTGLRWSGLQGRRRPQGHSATQSVCPPPTRYPPISACSVCLMSPRGVLHGCFRVTEKTHRSFSTRRCGLLPYCRATTALERAQALPSRAVPVSRLIDESKRLHCKKA